MHDRFAGDLALDDAVRVIDLHERFLCFQKRIQLLEIVGIGVALRLAQIDERK